MNWPLRRLELLAAEETYSFVGGPFGSKLTSQDYVDDGVPVIRGSNMNNGRYLDMSEFVYVSDSKVRDDLSGNLAKPLDLVFTQRGTLGQVAIIPEDGISDRYVVSQSQMKLTVDPTKAERLFLYYFFSSRQTKERLVRYASSSGVPHINLTVLRNFEVPVPPLDRQQQIASALCAYDDLIENNQRRIQLLEQSVRLLYREWFVHFRFPGHEHVKIRDGVPAGWMRRPLTDLVDYKEGPGLRNHQYREEGIPFLNIRTFEDDEIDLTKTQCIDEREVAEKYQHFLLREDDHVVSSSGTLGRVVTIRGCHLPVMLNTSLIRMRAKAPMRTWFLKAHLKHGDFLSQASAMATGAAQLNYGPSHLKAMTILFPSAHLVDVFEEYAGANYRQIKTLLDMNRGLVKTRDLLLPRLMSGVIAA